MGRHRTPLYRISLIAAQLLLIAACGDTEPDESGIVLPNPAPDEPPESGQTDPRPDNPAEVYTAGCPDKLPENGSICEEDRRICTYGGGWMWKCRSKAYCQDGTWQVTERECPKDSDASCPEAPPEGKAECDSGQPGDPIKYCHYPEEQAQCYCGGRGGGTWDCVHGAHKAEGCPDYLPNAGTACDRDAKTLGCHYGTCSGCNEFSWHSCESVACEDGVWTQAGVVCGS